MFKDTFKYYKKRNPSPDLANVIDFGNADSIKVRKIAAQQVHHRRSSEFGLISVKHWEIYELVDIPGLIFIKNPFTPNGQRYWITKCLKTYPKKPNKSNLDAHDILNDNETWWDVCFRSNDKERAEALIPKLRWVTLGYHHNWNTKIYSEECKTSVPKELAELTQFLAMTLNCSNFKAEAVIVNYYRMNSTLAGHTDHSEPNKEAPLFSISFGQTAIFLIGGFTQEDSAKALFLRSGDIIVMSGKSRLRYHGVPRILPSQNSYWDIDEIGDYITNCEYCEDDWKKARKYLQEARININVRQVLRNEQMFLY